MRILYIEEHRVETDSTRHTLAAHLAAHLAEAELSIVGGPQDAIAALQTRPFEAVLCDLHRPEGSGLALLAGIRRQAPTATLILLLDPGDPPSAEAALQAGADAYLIKQGDYLCRLATTLRHAGARRNHARHARPLQIIYAETEGVEIERTRRYLADHAPHLRLDGVAHGDQLLARLPTDAEHPCRYAVVLLDDRLAGPGALELAGIIRDQRHLDIPLVLITDAGGAELAARALRLGITEYVTRHQHYLPELVLRLEKSYHRVRVARAHRALATAHDRLTHLLEASPILLYTLRYEQGRPRAVSTSANLSALLGYRPEDPLRADWWVEGIHPDDRERVKAAQPQLLTRGRLVTRYRFHDAAGAVHWIRDEQRLLRDERGNPAEIAGAWSDITGHCLAAPRRQLDDNLFAVTRDGVLITDPHGRIERVNRALCRITGYAEPELLGQTPKVLRSGRHDTAFYGALWQRLLAEGDWDGEIWNRRRSGDIYPQRLSIRAIRDAAGVIRHFIGVATDLTQSHRSRTELEHLAHYDSLTDLPNRLMLQSRLDQALALAHRQQHSLGLMIVDLHRFNTINENLGHPAGDELLRQFGRRMRRQLREEDTLARLSGDEFAILLHRVDGHHAAAEVAGKVLEWLDAPFTLLGEHEIYMRANIGISLYPGDGDQGEELLRVAYAALHSLKAEGGGGYRFHTASTNVAALHGMALEAALRRAEARGELVLYYQPKVSLISGQITGAEALLRWRHDDRMVPPDEFIPIAERTGLIVAIGAWVIDEACRQIRAWQDQGLAEVNIAVNVSARQLRTGDLERVLRDALARHRVKPARLELELTESMLMEDPENAVERLNRLHALGVEISLDDFGTGYSSLAYLQRFPIDSLKIDRSFVTAIVEDPGAAVIVTAILDLARRLQLKVVAEGVETELQLSFLHAQHCDLMQGYLFSRPLPTAEFATDLAAGRLLPLPTSGSGLRALLVVDDEASICTALRRALRNEGYRIHEAADGHQALRVLAEHPIQVILSDQRMPGMTGAALMTHIKTLYPDTVRMVMSGYTDLEPVVEALNHGAIYKFLLKPWNNQQLLEQLRDAFDYHAAVIKPRAARRGM